MTSSTPSSLPAGPIVEVRKITRHFPGVTALQDVDLTLNPGEILAVVGENGAGKSTLMKILAGVQAPSSGSIRMDGQPVALRSVRDATDLGLVLIHQELNLFANLNVGANLFLGREPLRAGLIDRKRVTKQSSELLKRVGLDILPETLVGRLSIGQQQLVEIARALSANARVLIMDEPTSSLSQREAETLISVVRDLRANGVSIIYISHRLAEVRKLADRVLVLRDGMNAGELSKSEITHRRMVELMVGRDVAEFYQRHPHPVGDTLLATHDLATPAYPQQRLNFEIRSGEIVGVAGLVGAGRTELLRVLFGIDPPTSGFLCIDGHRRHLNGPRAAIAAGWGLVPEDRKLQGLILEMSIRENVGLPGLRRHQRFGGWLNRQRENRDACEMVSRLAIKTPSDRQITQVLSGGNQQKVVLGKWLALRPRLLLLDEPTRGVDIGAKQEIYQLMDQLASEGVAVLFVSSELEEIIGMSDRALVMHEGCISGELTREQLNEESIMHLATGNIHSEVRNAAR